MKASELIFDVWSDVSASISDDSVLDERQILFWINKHRALFIRNEYNKARTLNDVVVQDLGATELEAVDGFVYTGLSIDSRVLRTKQQIPVTIEGHQKPMFLRIGSLDQMARGFKIIDVTSAPFSGYGKFNRNEIFVFPMNRYLYVIGNKDNPAYKGLQYINIRGIFEDPTEASKFYHKDGTPCYSNDDQYPLSLYMYNYIKEALKTADLKQFYAPIEDPENDASNDTNQLNNTDGEKS